MAGVAPRILQDLAPLLLVTAEETLALVMEALSVLLKIQGGKWLTGDHASSLTAALLGVWQKNVKGIFFALVCIRLLTLLSLDQVLLSVITEVFEGLSTASYQATISQALPPLASALASVSKDETWVTSSALEIIASLMRGAHEGQLGQGFFASLGPALFKSVGETEDRDVIQVRESLPPSQN